MDYLISANILETLGISWQKILLYLANFAVLAVGLTFLLYKPVKKFITKRQDEIQKECTQAEQAREEVATIRKECEEQVSTAQAELKKAQEELIKAKKEAETLRESILNDANLQAEAIIREANITAEQYRKTAVEDTREQLANVAINLASNILEREINASDEQKLIDALLGEWENNE